MASFVKPSRGKELRSGLSKWELEELTQERRKTLDKRELHRELLADAVRCPLCFSLPCAIIAFILLILMGLYIVHPYRVGKSLLKTQCVYNRTEYSRTWSGYCSHRTNVFRPCFRIIVNFNTSTVVNNQATLLENEQALVHCSKECSFTQGRSGIFNKKTTCAWNSDVEVSKCLRQYRNVYGVDNATYPCYYDPNNIQNVIAVRQVSSSEAVLAVLIPSSLLIIWLTALIILAYDRYRRRVLDGRILVQRQQQGDRNGSITSEKLQKKSKPIGLNISFGGISRHKDRTDTFTEDTTLEKETPRRKRKKKLPCSKPHFQFNYLDEGIILEDKPISPSRDQPLDFNYLTIDSAPPCSCHHLDDIDVAPEVDDHYTSFTPVHGSPRRAGKILKYLPESFV